MINLTKEQNEIIDTVARLINQKGVKPSHNLIKINAVAG